MKIEKQLKRPPVVLVVEDDLEFSELLIKALTTLGCRVKLAPDGFSAVQELSTDYFDFVVLDWHMPGLNGKETLVKAQKIVMVDPLTESLWKDRILPVIIFSGSNLETSDLPRCKHFKFLKQWTKPIGIFQLRENVQDVLLDLNFTGQQ